MRIAVWHNLGSGGGKRALYNHAKVLLENGHHLEAWTTDYSSPDYLPLSNLMIENRKKIKYEFLKISRLKNPIKKEKLIAQLINNHCIECAEEIESKGFDLVFANSCCITNMPYIGKFTSLPRIVYLGEPKRFLYEAMPENIWQALNFKSKFDRKIVKDLLINQSRRIKVRNEIEAAKSYNKILVNSLFSRESVLRSYGLDASVCYLGIDIEDFMPGNIKKEPYVVGLGSITYLKSVHKAIEIIAEIPGNNRPVLKWIANIADEHYLKGIINLAKTRNVDFQYFLNISDSELKAILSKAAIMIYTSRLEPFGLAPLEANACGTYVVAIAEGGIRESISDGINGTLINGFKKKEIAEVIELFVYDLDLAQTKGVSAFKFVSEHWNKRFMSDNLLTEIENVFLNVE